MYRGGKICLTVHFKPLWAKNWYFSLLFSLLLFLLCLYYCIDHPPIFVGMFLSPRFGIAHALCLGLAPWLAAEIPVLVDSGMVKHKDDDVATSSDS